MTSRRTISTVTATALAMTGLVALPSSATAAGEPLTITPNPAYAGRAFEGWGTSLAWFANATGGYPDAVRQDLYNKVFGEDGLDLNIARYNIGGGNATDVPSYLRPGGAVEGWWNPDLAATDSNGAVTSTYADRERYAAAWDGDDPTSYNFDADASQRWWLDALAGRITRWEAFSNSPPYFLTQSGFVSGGIGDATTEQLAPEDMSAFADYLVTVVQKLEAAHGIQFDSLEPFNEPNTNYWSTTLGGDGWPTTASRQEGAHIGPANQDAMIAALRDRLAEPGTTTNVSISAMDETNPSIFVQDWNGWSDASKSSVSRLNVHAYGTNDRVVARDIAKASDKPLWMSEVGGDWDHTGFNLVNIDNGIGLASHIVGDLRELEPSAWVFWQPVEDLYNMQKVENLNWGSIFVDFDCNADGNSVRRLADGEADPSCQVMTNAKFNTARNFTHYIRPGDHLVPTNDDHTTAALPASGDGVTLVHVNAGDTDQVVTIDLSRFGAIAPGATVTPIVTTESPASDVTANALVEGAPVAIDPATASAVVTVPAKSVATFVVTGVSGVASDAPMFRDGDTVQLTGVQSGKPLTADGAAPTIRTAGTSAADVEAQSWTVHVLSGAGTNRERISLEAGDGRLLGTSGTSTALLSTSVEAAADDASLQWIPSTSDGETFSLLSPSAQRVLDVNGQSTDDGALVGTWTSNNGANQQWVIDPAPVVTPPTPTDDVPRTDNPPTYTQYGAISDPGTSAADYFQPYWYDTDGRHIQAHGGQIVSVTAAQLGINASDILTASEGGNTVYYWYGEDRSNGYWGSPGVAVYRSTDTLNWTNEGTALRTISAKEDLESPYFDGLYDTVGDDGTPDQARIDELAYYLNTAKADDYTAIFERPKVLYNETNNTWVMWWHADGRTTPGGSTYARSLAGVAVSDSPTGPFRVTGAYRMYNRENYQACTSSAVPGQARDMTVFKDEDGTAYIAYSSEENNSLYVAKLNADYTNVERTTTEDTVGIQYSESGEYPYLFADGTADAPVRGHDFQIVKECGHLEAPALFTHGGKYYVIASGATGWAPNAQTYHTADSILGAWIRGVEPDDKYENVAYSAIPEGGDGLLSVGDARKTTFGSQATNVLTLGPGEYVYMGDRWDNGNADSTYVWLPLTIGEGGRLEMHNPAAEDPARWGEGWDASYWDDHGRGADIWTVTDDHLPATVRRGADAGAVLPQTVAVTVSGQTDDVAVSWDASDLTTLGLHSITGTLAAGDGFGPGRTFTRDIAVWDYGQVNLAPSSAVTASSRGSLAGTVVDGDVSGKGWDDWASGGYPLDSSLTFTWPAPQASDAVVVHTYNDGGATWPSTVTVEYQGSDGSWVTSDITTDVSQDASAKAPVVSLDTSGLPATKAMRLHLVTATNTWQSISEVEIWGEPGTTNLCRGAGATVTASFHQTEYSTLPAANACDGSTSTVWSTWSSKNKQDQVTFTVETPTPYGVQGLSFTNTEGTVTGVSVDYRDIDGAWHPTSAQGVAPAANGQLTEVAFDAVTATGIRLTFTTPGSYLKIPELSIPATGPRSICADGVVTASFHQTAYDTFPETNACDGSTSTVWSTWTNDGWRDEVTFTIAAVAAYRVGEVSFTNTEGAMAAVSVDYRGTDGVWHATSAQGVSPAANGEPTRLEFDPVVATGVRLTFSTPGSYLKIPEIVIPGDLVAAPSGLTISGATTILVGDQLNLEASASPDGADGTVRWATSDASVATVSPDGTVVGRSYGSADITATSVADQAISAMATVRVLPAAWSATATYTNGDLVSYEGAVYQARWWSKGDEPGAVTTGPWAELGALTVCAAGEYAAWTASGVFVAGDLATYDGHVWQARWWARGVEPGQPYGAWEDRGPCLPGDGAPSVPAWAPSTVYVAGDVVLYEGGTWRARWWTRNNAPGGEWGPWEALGEAVQ